MKKTALTLIAQKLIVLRNPKYRTRYTDSEYSNAIGLKTEIDSLSSDEMIKKWLLKTKDGSILSNMEKLEKIRCHNPSGNSLMDKIREFVGLGKNYNI